MPPGLSNATMSMKTSLILDCLDSLARIWFLVLHFGGLLFQSSFMKSSFCSAAQIEMIFVNESVSVSSSFHGPVRVKT